MCVVFLLCALLTGSLLALSVSPAVMANRFTACARGEALGPLREQYGELAVMVTDYLTGRTDTFQYTFSWQGNTYAAFHDYEQRHMEDVRGLYSLCGTVTAICAATGLCCLLVLLMLKAGKILRKACLFVVPVFTALVLAAAIWAAFDFDGLFIAFHRLLFTNELWLLEPATDCLILLMPTEFFVSYAAMILATFLLAAAAIWCVAFFAGKRQTIST